MNNTTIGEVLNLKRGYDLTKEQMKSGSIPVVGSNGIIGYHNKSNVKKPVVTVGRSGTVGIPHIYYEDCWVHNTALYIENFKSNNPEYLFYLLKELKIDKVASSTGVPTLNRNFVHPLKIKFEPNIIKQNNIVKILKNIDLKIGNNIEINRQLELITKAMYNYWFLQFEFPNDDGNPYKSSGGKMVWNEELKREIPEGWKSIKLKNIVKKINRVYDYNKESKTYDLSIMPSNSISINDTSSSKDFETNLFAVKEGDILFGSIRPYLRKAGIASYDGAVAGTIHCYEVIKESDYNLALFTLTSENMFKYAINNSKGTKMPVITSDDLLEFMLPYNEELAKKFNKIKIRDIIIANVKQSNELASLRDFLLPLLMNGQVTFKEES